MCFNVLPSRYFLPQVSCHLAHEANTEQLFSCAGNLSDPNGKMDPFTLGVWTSVACNMKIYKPTVEDIVAHYLDRVKKGEVDAIDLECDQHQGDGAVDSASPAQ